MAKKFYVTTPIYYGTAQPHLGSLYSTLLADIFARWYKIQGYKTFFLTGTDEHGQKVAQAAHKVSKDPKSFVDSFIPEYKKTWHQYELAYDKFIRTTDSEHTRAVQAWIQTAQKSGDIYKSTYSGWYCTPCESYVVADEGVQEPLCPSCNRATNFVAEESYFFRLSAYQEKLLTFYKNNPDFITPRERLAEVISFIESGLRDLSISRTTISWGIPFPGDEKHVVYVWADALMNYASAIGYADAARKQEFDYWWPADMQVIGKDIVRFHAIYWPAFLMSAALQPPKQLLVHGWIKVNQQKMSKSFGNVIDPRMLHERYGADAVRYFLARYISVTHDTEFAITDLQQRITTDLVNDLGNLLNRMVILASKYDAMQIPEQSVWSDNACALQDACWQMVDDYTKHMQERMIHSALARAWKFINQVNSYFHAQEPWKLVKSDHALFVEVLAAVCNSLHVLAIVLWPIMPSKMTELLSSIGATRDDEADMLHTVRQYAWSNAFTLRVGKPLFEKVEEQEAGKQETSPMTIETDTALKNSEEATYITIDDLKKIDIRIGTIEQCEIIAQSEKLYKLHVDFGQLGKRTILAGVRLHYAAEELIGKQATFVVNLKPRTMLGHISEGMMLVVNDDQNMSLVGPYKKITNGVCLR